LSTKRWWQDAGIIAAVAALVVPLATAINGCFNLQIEAKRKEEEFRLARETHVDETRQRYLNWAIDPQRNADYRLSVLGFLIATLERSDPMVNWAKDESRKLEDDRRSKRAVFLSADEWRLWSEFLAAKQQDKAVRHPTKRGTGGSAKAQEKSPSRSNLAGATGGKLCCLTCNGLTICAPHVATECGSCSADDD
jgi:uncharacterized lipoprotein NlpE involved in copper resistance